MYDILNMLRRRIKNTSPYKKYRKTQQHKLKELSKIIEKENINKYGYITKDDIIASLNSMPNSSVLYVNCSWNNMYRYKNGCDDFLYLLLEYAEKMSKTILMPALSKNEKVFDVKRTPTYCGVIQELFRREPCVIRSLHPRHSMCGYGLLAADILEGHENCVYADGKNSPWDRLRLYNAVGINYGMYPFQSLTFLHWIEDYEPELYPSDIHNGPYNHEIIKATGEVLHKPFYQRHSTFESYKFGMYFTKKALWRADVSSMPTYCCDFALLGKELISCRNRNIILYRRYSIKDYIKYFDYLLSAYLDNN